MSLWSVVSRTPVSCGICSSRVFSTPPLRVVDCSHANSSKQPELQPSVLENVANQILEGNTSIIGLMIESNLHAGNQDIPANLDDLKYGVSVTDGCIDWATTEASLRAMRDTLKAALVARC